MLEYNGANLLIVNTRWDTGDLSIEIDISCTRAFVRSKQNLFHACNSLSVALCFSEEGAHSS